VPTIKDRIVQAATKMVIEPIFECQFLDMSYGFRPGRGCKDALREVDGLIKDGYTFVVDADLKGYFDSIPQDKLLERVKERISDGRVIDLIDSWLKQDVMHDMERWTPTSGTPQGAVVSPLLANVYLHPLDEAIRMDGHRMVRFADDFVILCRTREEADAALERVQTWVTANGLTLHPDKTHVGNCANWGEGFDFLGYRFEAGRRMVRKKSLKAFKDNVRSKTRRTQGRSLSATIADLNPMLRGWLNYFKHAQPWTFKDLDGLIRRRLRATLRKQEKRPGFGRNQNDQRRWPNAFFAEAGLFALYTARQTESHSR
jgi:RNA-directed DNA polymerase